MINWPFWIGLFLMGIAIVSTAWIVSEGYIGEYGIRGAGMPHLWPDLTPAEKRIVLVIRLKWTALWIMPVTLVYIVLLGVPLYKQWLLNPAW